jgi:hypothetical protein
LKDFLRRAGGGVLRAEVVLGADGRSRGYGCATFQTADDAQQAIKTLHDTELSGRVVVVRPDKAALRHTQLSAVGGRRVFVGNLPWDARQVGDLVLRSCFYRCAAPSVDLFFFLQALPILQCF